MRTREGIINTQKRDFLTGRTYRMKKMVAVALASGWLAVAQTPEPAPATDVTAADIQGMLKQLPKEKITDAPIRVADVGGYRVGVFVVFRPKSNEAKERAAAHNTRVTEIYYILEGSGTLVTGGKIVGDRIDGGVTRHDTGPPPALVERPGFRYLLSAADARPGFAAEA
jgi:mannose-6-phosphate isomerase-like protein (cupin superfamily)